MLDMSKAFDMVRRNELFDILEETLEKDELHMMKILVEDVVLKVRIGKKIGEDIRTNIGVPQGDCMSPILFIIYLAEAMKTLKELITPSHKLDHNYHHSFKRISIDQQYADDTGWATRDREEVRAIKQIAPKKLKEKNLGVNESKTEEYEVKWKGDDEWKTAKYLGSLLETEQDIKRRKSLALATFRNLSYIFENNKVSLQTKLKLLRSHVESILLYNSEIWTMTVKLEQEIDIFQRNLVRKILNIRWPDTISNAKLYEKTKVTKWSKKIKERRLKWYGHLLRLPENTPAKQALREAELPMPKVRGGQKLTWLRVIDRDLKAVKGLKFMKIEGDGSRRELSIEEIANDRHLWQELVSRAMSS